MTPRTPKLSRRTLLSLAGATLTTRFASAAPAPIDLDALPDSGLHTASLNHAIPDEHGVHLSRTLAMANVDHAIAYAGQWWPAGGNRVYPHVLKDLSQTPEGTLCLLIRQTSGNYLALVPMADEQAYAWLGNDGAQLTLKLGTQGRSTLDGKRPLFAWSRSPSPYAAMGNAWKTALASMQPKTASLREQKPYPEMFRYLGWCSWEAYNTHIDEPKMLRAVEQIEASGVPIRYLLMDEGHADNQTLRADKTKFPRGYTPLTSRKDPNKIRWFGLWWAFLGAAHGIQPPGQLGPLRDAMMLTENGVLVPKPDEPSANQFFDHLMRQSQDGGFDFVKIDFMVDALPLYAGNHQDIPTLGGLPPNTTHAIRNPYAGAALLMRACQQSARSLHGILNCNWHNAACLFNSGSSAVGRCSEDYQSNQIERAKAHIYHAFTAIPWLGQLAWGDHDMFHSSDHVAALPMAISKALSGGPIYLSDEPTAFVKPLIAPLCFADGRLLRPLAPGAPVEDDLSYLPDTNRLLRIIAPLANAAAAIGIFHLESSAVPLTTSITPEIYRRASSMMQPFPGPWLLPSDGLLVYDVLRKTASLLGEGHQVSLAQFGLTLLQLTPIISGWSLIGTSDKYLPAAAVTGITYSSDQLSFTIEEPGPILLWSAHGKPLLDHLPMTPFAENLYIAEIKQTVSSSRVQITR